MILLCDEIQDAETKEDLKIVAKKIKEEFVLTEHERDKLRDFYKSKMEDLNNGEAE